MDCIIPIIEYVAITVSRREATEFLPSDPLSGLPPKQWVEKCRKKLPPVTGRSIIRNMHRDQNIFLKEENTYEL